MRGSRQIGVAVALLAGTIAVVTAPASATRQAANPPIAVTTTADVVDPDDGVLSLREAFDVANAQPGDDTIDLVRGSTYDLGPTCGDGTDDANVDGDLDHADPSGALRIDGHPGSDSRYYQRPMLRMASTCPSRVIEQHGQGLLTLFGITVTGGHPGLDAGGGDGGGVRAASSLAVSIVIIEANQAPVGRGGGLAAPSLTTYASEIRGNQAGAASGLVGGGAWAVDLDDNYSHYLDNEVTGPQAQGGGVAATATVRTHNSWFIDNTAVAGGGGVAAPDILLWDYTATHDNRVTGEAAPGGGVLGTERSGGSSVVVDQVSTVARNVATGRGGGIAADHVTVTERSEVSGNRAVDRGSLDGPDGGGGIAAVDVELSDSSVDRNRVGAAGTGGPARGGGIATVSLSMSGSTVSRNESAGGGGIHALEVDARNSTVIDNTAGSGPGGGILVPADEGGGVTLDHVTVTGNRSPSGANLSSAAPGTISRSILGEPHGGGGNCAGVRPVSGGMNLVGVGGGCHLRGDRDRLRVSDLGLGWPSYNHFDRAVRTPVTTAASIVPRFRCSMTTDELGFRRPQGRKCEAGAVEVPSW